MPLAEAQTIVKEAAKADGEGMLATKVNSICAARGLPGVDLAETDVTDLAAEWIRRSLEP